MRSKLLHPGPPLQAAAIAQAREAARLAALEKAAAAAKAKGDRAATKELAAAVKEWANLLESDEWDDSEAEESPVSSRRARRADRAPALPRLLEPVGRRCSTRRAPAVLGAPRLLSPLRGPCLGRAAREGGSRARLLPPCRRRRTCPLWCPPSTMRSQTSQSRRGEVPPPRPAAASRRAGDACCAQGHLAEPARLPVAAWAMVHKTGSSGPAAGLTRPPGACPLSHTPAAGSNRSRSLSSCPTCRRSAPPATTCARCTAWPPRWQRRGTTAPQASLRFAPGDSRPCLLQPAKVSCQSEQHMEGISGCLVPSCAGPSVATCIPFAPSLRLMAWQLRVPALAPLPPPIHPPPPPLQSLPPVPAPPLPAPPQRRATC